MRIDTKEPVSAAAFSHDGNTLYGAVVEGHKPVINRIFLKVSISD